ncbi:MAG TPA: hypothetical protein VGN63_19180 [Flavisolibacter sp.]|jgi:hypothetical protein|nr:hypothetical protein [Flavisolibacter sp.]
MKILFVHGRAQEMFEEAALKKIWMDTFKNGLEAAGINQTFNENDIIFPYYGKKLEQLVADYKIPVEDIVMKGGPVPEKDAKFFHEFLAEVAQNAMVSPAEINEQLDAEVTEKGPLNWGWVQAILRAVDKKGKWGVQAIKRFTYDVFLYLTVPAIRQLIDAEVAAKMNNEPTVVVGHSLGTIICYNVLSNNPNWNVSKLITLGSPLGLHAVRKYLKSPLQMPACVKNGWYNAYDDRDVVALNPLDKKYFDITPSIVNKSTVNNHTENRHGIVGYLNDGDVAGEIWEAIYL